MYDFPASVVKRICKTALLTPPLSVALRPFRGNGAILMYHRITPQPQCDFHPNRRLEVDADSFEKQLHYLSKHCLCLSLDEMIERLNHGTLRYPALALTFDDGYRDNLQWALPLLQKYSVPAAVYVTTGSIDGASTPWWNELEHILANLESLEFECQNRLFRLGLGSRPEKAEAFAQIEALVKSLPLAQRQTLMLDLRERCPVRFDASGLMLSWNELQLLAACKLITIGAHTVNHPNLSTCTAAELESELLTSKTILQEQLGREIRHLAYPYGTADDCGPREFEAAARAGFLSAVTTCLGHLGPQHARSLTALPRIAINAEDCGLSLLWKLSGGNAIAQRIFAKQPRCRRRQLLPG